MLPTDLTATEAASRIRSRQLSSVELTRLLLEAVARDEPALGAWELVDNDQALAAAAACDRALASGDCMGPLAGVPFGVKDVFAVAGLPTRAGFSPFARRVPAVDAAAVRSLKRAGGIALGKTVTAQLAYSDPPRTLNPWSAHRTPGGSSSGSAAAVAAGHVPVALATQTGGSTLRPAAFTGCVGFKPSYGRIDLSGVLPLAWSLDHVGVITRSVDDCVLLFDLLTDSETSEFSEPALSSPRLGVVVEAADAATPDVRAALDSAVARFKSEGAEVFPVRLGVLEEIRVVHQVIMQCEATAAYGHLLSRHRSSFQPRLRAFLETGRTLPADVYIQAQRLRRRVRAAVDVACARAGVLVLPTVSTVAPERSSTGDSLLQSIFSLTGCPAISIPSGPPSIEHLPGAIQLATAWGADRHLLTVARWCSAILTDPSSLATVSSRRLGTGEHAAPATVPIERLPERRSIA